jgi:hypothetical protein
MDAYMESAVPEVVPEAMGVEFGITAQGGVSVTATAGVSRIAHPACAHRLQLDVALTDQHVGLRLHQGRLVTAVPQGARAPVVRLGYWT